MPEEAEALVLDCLRSGRLAQGERVAALEDEFAAMCGVDHAVAVGNGTLALELALAVLDLAPGDEVLTSPFTLAGTDTTIVTVPLNFAWSGVGSAARSVLNSGAVNYGVDGSFTVKLPANAGDLAVPFTGSGTIPLLKP